MEEVEKILNDGISSRLSDQIMENIDEMDFIQMELNEETNQFEYQAELVLCSKNSIVTNIQLQAQEMSKYGLSPEQIESVLAIVTQDSKGF